MTTRTLTPELLDSLPHDSPDAERSRRDLRMINWGLGNSRWFARTLPALVRAGEHILELGAGTGELGASLASRGLALDGLDRAPRPANWATRSVWHQADIFGFSGYDRYGVVIGNLIFHHFTDAQLADLGARFRDTARVVIASEPKRSRISRRMFALTAPLWGAHPITIHDGRVSIEAGFLGHELSAAFGLDESRWEIRHEISAVSTYRMIAVRRA